MDFWEYIRQPQPYRWLILLASAIPFALIMIWAVDETVLVPPPPPKVTYITSYAPDRSDAEIVESNIANQKRKDELRAQQAEIEERKRDMYRELGRATGVDVDAMEERIEADRAAEAKAKAEAEAKATAQAEAEAGTTASTATDRTIAD